MQIYVDADACPVKEEAAKVAARHTLVIHYVSNSHMRLPFGDNVKRVVVADGADAAREMPVILAQVRSRRERQAMDDLARRLLRDASLTVMDRSLDWSLTAARRGAP